jgi:hypothetical protein
VQRPQGTLEGELEEGLFYCGVVSVLAANYAVDLLKTEALVIVVGWHPATAEPSKGLFFLLLLLLLLHDAFQGRSRPAGS